jgi:flagellar hook-length control protein FliK
MAIAHSKQANMNAVENKEPNNTSDKNVSNRQIVDPYEVNLLAGSMALPVSEQTNIGAVTKREPNDVTDGKASKISTLKNHLPSTFGVKESSLDMAENSANNGADINASASIKNNFDTQIINNMVAAMNLASKENHIAENDVSISQFVQNVSIPKPIKANEKDTSAFLLQNSKLMPAKHDSSLFMEKSASNDFNQAVDALNAKPKISVEKISQNTDILTNTFITQHSVNENILQAQGQQTFHNTQAFSKPALGEQIINIVVKEIQVPQEDGIDSLRIEITPPDLGDLEIELQKQGKDLEVRILASTEAAAEAIKDHTSVLKNILGNQDFNRVQVNVDIGKREHSNQQQQGNAKQDDQNNQHEQRILKVRIHNGVIDTFV